MLNKHAAGVLALLVGGFGVHRFYLGQRFWGVFRFALFVLLTMLVIETNEDIIGFLLGMHFLTAAVEGLIFFTMPKAKFDAKYNKEAVDRRQSIAAPASVDELKAEGVEYFRSGDYDLATEAFLDALDQRADDPGLHFNLACAYAKVRKLPQALQHLELAISYGLPAPERIERHPSLEWARAQPMYQQFRRNNYRQLNLVPVAPVKSSVQQTEALPLQNLEKTAAPAKPVINSGDLLEQLRTLGALRERGILTETEFAEQKDRLMR